VVSTEGGIADGGMGERASEFFPCKTDSLEFQLITAIRRLFFYYAKFFSFRLALGLLGACTIGLA
jgi:hypothetical protein